jgi:hypothetical protein
MSSQPSGGIEQLWQTVAGGVVAPVQYPGDGDGEHWNSFSCQSQSR